VPNHKPKPPTEQFCVFLELSVQLVNMSVGCDRASSSTGMRIQKRFPPKLKIGSISHNGTLSILSVRCTFILSEVKTLIRLELSLENRFHFVWNFAIYLLIILVDGLLRL
jgi:hypothetical protein